jgi:hypothetical protein
MHDGVFNKSTSVPELTKHAAGGTIDLEQYPRSRTERGGVTMAF